MPSKCNKTVEEIIQDIEDTYRCAAHSIDRHNILAKIQDKIMSLKAQSVNEIKTGGDIKK